MNPAFHRLPATITLAGLNLLLALFLFACNRDSASRDVYTCPMHPTVVSDKPGACPVCNMELVKRVPGAEVVMDRELAAATESPNEHVLSSVTTVRGKFTALPVEIVRTGVVTYDARNRSTVSARVAGRLEKVYVRYLYQAVRKGEKIADIYSPDLAAAQREFVYLLRTDPGNEALVGAARQRLRNFDMTDQQLNQVAASGEAQYVVSVYSPAAGVVVQRDGQAPMAPIQTTTTPSVDMASASSMASGSSASATTPIGTNTGANDLLREGAYVTAGQPLLEVVNFSSLLLEINLPATAVGNVRAGDPMRVLAGEDSLQATVDLIEPFAQGGDPFIKVRSYLRKTQGLTVGQLITATLRLPPAEGLWLPVSSVYDLGTRKIVFIKQGARFTPTEVITGLVTDDQIMVISGVASGDEVASHAQFLVDHEGFINTK